MERQHISDEIIRQLETLTEEAAHWAKNFDNNTPKIDLRYVLKKHWGKDPISKKQLFRYQPAP